MADVEVLIQGEPVTVSIDSRGLDVSVSDDNDFEIFQRNDDDFQITAKATSLTALNISLFARVMIFIGGNPTASELILRYEFTDQILFVANLALSRGSAGVGATVESAFSVEKNGVEFGTATFEAGSNVAVFSGTATTFNVGDILTVYAPPSQDATLAEVSLTLAGTRVV